MPNISVNANYQTPTKLYGLDHLRALAIIFVFLYHYRIPIFGHPEWINNAAKFGWTGVDLFFVLSGFLISSQLFNSIQQGRHFSFKTFFLKRFFRIIPAYLTVVAIYFLVPAFHEREALPALWRFLTFTQNFGLNIQQYGTFSHAWSLCVEEHFYLFMPILLLGISYSKLFNKAYWILIAFVILGFAVRHFSYTHYYLSSPNGINWYKYIYYPTYNRLDGLITGVAIAAFYCFLPNIFNSISRWGNTFIALGIFTLVCAYYICYKEQSYLASVAGFFVVSLGYGFITLGAISPGSFLYKFSSKTTTFIATLSYAIYLTHKGVVHLTQHYFSAFGIDVNSNAMLIIGIATSILAALLLHYTIEKPFMKLRNKLLKGLY